MATDRESARQHAEWLSLIEASGPFLSIPVLMESFPQGLDRKEDESEVRQRLRLAYEEWADNQAGTRPDPAIHTQWLRFVLEEVLEMRPDVILEGQQIAPNLRYESREHGETVRPQLVIRSPYEQQNRLLIQLYPYRQKLDKVLPEQRWKASPATRMMELLRASGVRLGLITNGEHWMLIDAPPNETTGYYSWYSTLWLEEPLTLRAFRSLLGMERFFNVPQEETLEALLEQSATRQQEVTDQLGDQVRRAVETLVRTLDRLDKDSQHALLRSIAEKELYEAALTVMMRLVFLLSAEERDMLLLGDPLYDQNYAVSTMHKQLREQADQQGEEVLGLRYDAWSRLLATFRIVYGGVDYHDLHLPAYGGHLFDPDRFPFLEGRQPGTSWREQPAFPLRIDNRTVMHLLEALQYLQVKLPGGGAEPRRLSFRGLDIEQIGHVYEGLLDHTARRAGTTILGLVGKSDTEPEATLDELEVHARKGDEALLTFLQEVTGRQPASLRKQLDRRLEKQDERSRLMAACENRQDIFERVLPFAGLLRKDTFGNFLIVTPDSVYVTHGQDRRSTGTHYTPRSLTEPIVQHTLDPLVYIGPAEGLPEQEWKLRSAAEILDLKICDMAMGSGAFLVQSCRYLSEKLVQAWENAEQEFPQSDSSSSENPPGSDQPSNVETPLVGVLRGDPTNEGATLPNVGLRTNSKPRITPTGQLSQGRPSEELLPIDRDERLALARRLVSERCLYGVDKNPMAAEMAKLSLWLITLAKNRPFTFLDHALRCGDSLLGADERQLYNGSLDAKSGEIEQISQIRFAMQYVLPTVIHKRRQIATLADRDIHDIETKERLLKEADQALEIVKLGGDLLIGIALSEPKRRANLISTTGMNYAVLAKAYDEALHQPQTEQAWLAKLDGFAKMRAEVDELLKGRKPFHWPLEFPEVFIDKGDASGFSAIMSNPPFQGGLKITGALSTEYRDYLVEYLANDTRGSADLCAYFFLRATGLVRKEGMSAMLATNTIAQGNTREVGLDRIIASGWTIPRAIPSRKWPGEASLEVACVWLRYGQWNGQFVLNDVAVKGITAFLTIPGKATGNPYRLKSNENKSFQGSVVLGMGFVLEPNEAQALIAKASRNKDVIFPYLNAEDLNSQPNQSPSRWIINFHNWHLEIAETYRDCIEIVREKVMPQREAASKFARKEWWLHHRDRSELYSAIADMKRVLVIPLHSKYMICTWEPSNIVYSHGLCVIATESDADFALIQCTFHDNWARANGSTLETRMRYTPSDCFETFPFPTDTTNLDDIGERYYTYRQSIMLARQEGLTKTYNRFHDPDEHAPDIVRLRELHREMDEAVARAYRWDDLRLEHGFLATKQGVRYTISEAARREVLDRLLLLNHQRHEEEVQAGLWATKGASKGKKGKKGGTRQKSSQANKNKAPESIPVEQVSAQQETLF
jgi:hypothetical protein